MTTMIATSLKYLALGCGLALLALYARPAFAFDGHPDLLGIFDHGPKQRYVKKHRPRGQYSAPRVKAWVRVEPAKPNPFDGMTDNEFMLESGRCHRPVAVVGSQRVSEAEALDSAEKAWMEEVRFSYGEAYMTIEYARNKDHICSRSSIGEVLNQTMHRCKLIGQPCRPTVSSPSIPQAPTPMRSDVAPSFPSAQSGALNLNLGIPNGK